MGLIYYCSYRDQKLKYNLLIEELSKTFEELKFQLNEMIFLNNRNTRVAEMMFEISESSKKLKEKGNFL